MMKLDLFSLVYLFRLISRFILSVGFPLLSPCKYQIIECLSIFVVIISPDWVCKVIFFFQNVFEDAGKMTIR